MKKFLTLFYVLSIVIALGSCSKDKNNSVDLAGKDVVFVPKDLETKSFMTPGLINSWENGDNIGVFGTYVSEDKVVTNNGQANARFTVTGAPSAISIVQPSVLPKNRVLWKSSGNMHSFYLYSPYVAGVTARDAVSFSITSNQTQDEKHVWHNTNPYNFQWDALVDITGFSYGVSSNVVRFELKRMLPVCEFVISKVDESVDGYYLESILLIQDNSVTTKLLKEGQISVNLNDIATYSNTSALFNGLTAVDRYLLSTTAKSIDLADLQIGEGFSMFMSVSPVTDLGKHNVVATFVSKTDPNDRQSFMVSRTTANYDIVNGVGNITRYYLSIGKAPSSTGGDTTIKLEVGIKPHPNDGSDIDLSWNGEIRMGIGVNTHGSNGNTNLGWNGDVKFGIGVNSHSVSASHVDLEWKNK